MKTALKVVRLFLNDRTAKTIREISRKIKADYRITHTGVQRLIEKKILMAETIGKSTLCKLNTHQFSPEIFIAEIERRDEILKDKNLRQLYYELSSKVKTSFFIVLLFGSYAKGLQTKSSDIDLLFICNEKDFENKVTDILSLLPLKTHPIVITEEEFIRMKESKKSNVVHEAINSNIVLIGIEQFYRCLIKNE